MKQPEQIHSTFCNLVNMTKKELDDWLQTKESRSVGWTSKGRKTSDSGEESIGHESGRMISLILGKRADELSDEDYIHMARVNGYIKRHLAQGPTRQQVEKSRWRCSLMNWGHDPLKEL